MSEKAVGRESDKFMLRFPDGMRERLKAAAAANNRSMNAEIVVRLERSFMSRDEITKLDLAEELRALRVRLEQLDSDLERRVSERKAARSAKDKG